MKLLFVDETDRQANATSRTFFCICGLSIDESVVLTASNELEEIKTHYGLSNLKESRKSGLDEATRISITTDVFNCLSKFEVKIVGIILGDFSLSFGLPKKDMYMGAMSFLMERFALSLVKERASGLVIFDSVDHALEKDLRQKFYEYIREEKVQMVFDANPRCAFRDEILPSLLFSDDNHSVLIQAVDLVATSLNSAIVNTAKSGTPIIVSSLPAGNKFLAIYWPLFATSPGGKIEGWGIKVWD